VNAFELTEALGGKWMSNYGKASCPVSEAHANGDQSKSFSISEKDGKVLVKCHTGCDQETIIERLKERELWPRATSGPEFQIASNGVHSNGTAALAPVPDVSDTVTRIVTQYNYTDEQGVLLYQSIRLEPKDFRQRQADGKGGWRNNLQGVRRVLYKLPELLRAGPNRMVFIVEGEKDVDRLRSIGLVATTNAMGAGKWTPEYNAALKGRNVTILPDNDDPGRKHAEQVTHHLLAVAASVRVIHLPGLSEKGDVSDWLNAGGSRPRLEELVVLTSPQPKPQPAYPVQTLAALMEKPHETGIQIVEGIFWERWTHWLFSKPNTGKTVFLLTLGLHVAAGKAFLGRAVKQTPVLMISEDSPEPIIQDYVERICELEDIDWRTIPFYINVNRGLRLTDQAGIEKLLEAYDSCPEQPGLALFDACERLVPSETFSTGEIDPFGQALANFSDRGCTNAVIDHVRKDTKENSGTDLMQKLYGAGAKGQICDAAIHFEGSFRDGKVHAEWAKFRGQFPPPFDITFHYDSGFTLKNLPPKELSPTEQKVTRYLANATRRMYTLAELSTATSVSERSIERVLPRLVQVRWLARAGDRDRAGFTYGLSADAPSEWEV
jgi:hypothetical protein